MLNGGSSFIFWFHHKVWSVEIIRTFWGIVPFPFISAFEWIGILLKVGLASFHDVFFDVLVDFGIFSPVIGFVVMVPTVVDTGVFHVSGSDLEVSGQMVVIKECGDGVVLMVRPRSLHMVVPVMTIVPVVAVMIRIMFLGDRTERLAIFPNHPRVKG